MNFNKRFRVVTSVQYEDEHPVVLNLGIEAPDPETAAVKAGVRVGRRMPGGMVITASVTEEKHESSKIIQHKFA